MAHLFTESIVLLLYFLRSCLGLFQQAFQLCNLLLGTLYVQLLCSDLNKRGVKGHSME